MTTGGSARFDCPVPPRLSPHAEATQDWLTRWLARVDPTLDGAALDQLHRAGFARYAARLYPEATEVDLRAISALFTWFFLVDDLCDSPRRSTGGPAFAGGTSTPQDVQALGEATLRLLRGCPRAAHPGLPAPLHRILVDGWRVPAGRMPERWRTRFTDAVAHHLDGVAREAANKAAGREPTRAEYLPLRRATSAAYVSYTLIEFATGQVLPDAVYHHPVLVRIAATANDLLSWFNDVVSLDRDRVGSGGHNLVLVTAREHGVVPEEAVGLVAEQWRAAMARFGELCAAVPSFGPGLDEAVAVHLDGFANSIRGTIDWSHESTRYPV